MPAVSGGTCFFGGIMEKWDAYNSSLEKIDGMILIRGEENSIPSGIYHLVCEILVQHTDSSILLMQRDFKKHYGGMWEASAGGSALMGETPLECAKRELFEETGITALTLTELGRVVSDETHCVYVEFLCVTDCNKNSVILQQGETVNYRWISRHELFSMSKNELVTKRMLKFVDNGCFH